MKVVELASAKINLTLSVGAKRADGYHDLESVMTCVAVNDVVTLENGLGEGVETICDWAELPVDESNLAFKAAQVFFKKTGVACDGLKIVLEKHIPMQAGLGGGSADAAAVLRGLRKIYRPDMPVEDLKNMAAEVGSDVPFCVGSETALAEGRGEKLTALPQMPLCWVVLCKPDCSFSTAAMYRKIDEQGVNHNGDQTSMVQALQNGSVEKISDGIYNVFEQVVPSDSEVFVIKNKLIALGALNAMMSGSGSAVFGIFAEETVAKAAYQALEKEYPQTFIGQCV